MKTTTYQFDGYTVRIHDPAETPEQKAKQHERLVKACVKFWEDVEAGR